MERPRRVIPSGVRTVALSETVRMPLVSRVVRGSTWLTLDCESIAERSHVGTSVSASTDATRASPSEWRGIRFRGLDYPVGALRPHTAHALSVNDFQCGHSIGRAVATLTRQTLRVVYLSMRTVTSGLTVCSVDWSRNRDGTVRRRARVHRNAPKLTIVKWCFPWIFVTMLVCGREFTIKCLCDTGLAHVGQPRRAYQMRR